MELHRNAQLRRPVHIREVHKVAPHRNPECNNSNRLNLVHLRDRPRVLRVDHLERSALRNQESQPLVECHQIKAPCRE